MASLRWKLGILIFLIAGVIPGFAQEESAQAPPPPAPGETIEEKSLATLRALQVSIFALESEIAQKRAELRDDATPEEKEAATSAILALNSELNALKDNYEKVATGIDLEAFSVDRITEVNLGAEVQQFLQPIVKELKEITSRPREIEELRTSINYQTKRLTMAERATHNIEALISRSDDEAGLRELARIRDSWRQKMEQAQSELTVAQFQLDEKLADSESLWGTTREVIASFFRSRGRNLLFAVCAFVAVSLGMRFLHRLFYKIVPLQKHQRQSFYFRLGDILYFALTIAGATGAALIVLYSAADWVLLGLAILFLFGIAWTGKQTLPLVYEQIKLMLNLGAVREGERLVYNGVPWQVQRIQIYTDLVNPALEGGRIRLPIRELISLHSRPFGQREPWFPSESGDWVILSDGTYGKVVMQTPDWVQMVLLGGSRKTYAAADFLTLSPENLSANFRLKVRFGIDYQHQAVATTEVPAVLQEKLTAELAAMIEPEELIHLSVEFSGAASSSLDYTVLADFAGSAAARYQKLMRAIPRICVDACNEHGWVIPFTQIMLHQSATVASRGVPQARDPRRRDIEPVT